MSKLIAVVGPTATGKSQLALKIAKLIDGEIVNADSRQIYKLMDIGTSKPTDIERTDVPHHLIDIIFPSQDYNLASFQIQAKETLTNIWKRGKIPILVGGTGQYIWSVLENWNIPKVKPDIVFRKQMEEKVLKEGALELYNKLYVIDSISALMIGPTNARRLIRALEVHKDTGLKPSSIRSKGKHLFENLIIGLTMDRDMLRNRINNRIDNMIEAGLVEEVTKLVELGYNSELSSMSSIGYREIHQYLDGKLSLTDAISKIKTDTYRLVRRQYNWFKLEDKRINWFQTKPEQFLEIRKMVINYINS